LLPLAFERGDIDAYIAGAATRRTTTHQDGKSQYPNTPYLNICIPEKGKNKI